MKILSGLIQGSPEWKAHRATARNASDAPAVMGVSPYKSRTQLLDERATGVVEEVDSATQKRFDDGHKAEEAARPIAEEIVGDELFPVIGQSDDDYLSASFDGITMDGNIVWECKSWNQSKVADIEAGRVPECDHWQVVQQLVISGAEKLLYMVTDGTKEKERHLWVTLNNDDAGRLIRGWKQFDEDLANHEPAEKKPQVSGAAPESLPALHIELSGAVKASNLPQFKEHALKVLGNINRDLKTDQDFANAEQTVKWAKDVEDRLAAAKQHALSQTADIDALFRTIDDVQGEARSIRLELDKLVKERKKTIKVEIAQAGRAAVDAHINNINSTLDGVSLPQIVTDFNAAMKGKRTVETLQSAADDEVARAKILASETADRIRANLKRLADAGNELLFADRQNLVLKDGEDLDAVIKTRIAEHEAKERDRIERIRQEEQQKAEAEAAEKARREAVAEAEAPEKPQEQRAPEPDKEPAPQPVAQQSKPDITPAPRKGRPTDDEIIEVLALHFRVHEFKIIEWIGDMDLNRASEKLASNY